MGLRSTCNSEPTSWKAWNRVGKVLYLGAIITKAKRGGMRLTNPLPTRRRHRPGCSLPTRTFKGEGRTRD